MKKYRNKYRIASARAPWWDYGWNAIYFITICTCDRLHYFGKIQDHKMVLSKIGKLVETCWLEIPQHFPFVTLGEFVVMPNHVHGIIIINKSKDERAPEGVETQAPEGVETQDLASLPMSGSKNLNRFGPQSRNLGSIIRGFKVGVTKNAHAINVDFSWQSRYHDRIIRDYAEFRRIVYYIQTNPENWNNDRFHNR